MHSALQGRGGSRLLRSLLAGMILALAVHAARAELPRLTAGAGTGLGATFHREYTSGAPFESSFGRYAAAAWWADLAWSFRSRAMIGLHGHLLRVPLEEQGVRLGTVDLFPALFTVGYHLPCFLERMHGFLSAGVGVAWTRFVPGRLSADWASASGGEIGLSAERPLVLAAKAGLGYELGRDFLAEISLMTVQMEGEVSYRRWGRDASGAAFISDRTHLVKGRHVLVAVGLRWWFAWW